MEKASVGYEMENESAHVPPHEFPFVLTQRCEDSDVERPSPEISKENWSQNSCSVGTQELISRGTTAT